MNELWYGLAACVGVFFALPLAVFLCVRAGTLGYLRAVQLFRREKGKDSNE